MMAFGNAFDQLGSKNYEGFFQSFGEGLSNTIEGIGTAVVDTIQHRDDVEKEDEKPSSLDAGAGS
jgi:hypothetical protein